MFKTLQETPVKGMGYKVFFLSLEHKSDVSKVVGVIDTYLIIMFRLDPVVDIPTCLNQTETVRSQNLTGQRLPFRAAFASIKVCLIKGGGSWRE